MRLSLVLILFFLFSSANYAQNYNFPKNPDVGKCYQRCFTYDKPLEWKEKPCSKKNKTELSEKELIVIQKNKIKLTKYQEKLLSLGYAVDINGFPDDKTVNAHHKYLKQKIKEEKRKARLERKEKRSNRKK